MIYAWVESVSQKSCLVRAITPEGVLLNPFEAYRSDKALEYATKYWHRFQITWLGDKPWSSADFREAVNNYEKHFGIKLNGFVEGEKKAW